MKKVLFLAATAAVVLSSCSNEEITSVSNVPSENGKTAIEISAYASGVTRYAATVSDLASLANGFSLTAGYAVDDQYTSIFNQKTFTAAANGTCTSTELYYWPSNVDAEVSFYGFYPASASTCTLNVSDEKMTIIPDAETDVIAAYAKTSLSTLKAEEATSVALSFKHVLAQVKVNVEFSSAYVAELGAANNVTFNLTGLTLKAPSSSEYNFAGNVVTTDGEKDYAFFTYNPDITALSSKLTITEKTLVGTAMLPAATPVFEDNELVAQTECELTVSYEVTIGSNDAKSYTKSGSVSLAAGYLNEINISLSGDKPIYVSASVSNWETENANEQNVGL